MINVFKKDPAAWTAAILLLFTLLFGMLIEFLSRKKMRLEFGNKSRYDGYWITATNSSRNRNIKIVSYGYKKLDGEIVDEIYHNVVLEDSLKPEFQEELCFYDGVKGEPKDIDICQVYYVYIKDSTGKIYKKYMHSKIVSWILKNKILLHYY